MFKNIINRMKILTISIFIESIILINIEVNKAINKIEYPTLKKRNNIKVKHKALKIFIDNFFAEIKI